MAADTPDPRDVRRSYEHATLDLDDLTAAERADPLRAVRRWLDDAIAAGDDPEPTAMVLATVRRGERAAEDPSGAGVDDGVGADARVVLCKGIDHGIVFFTNGTSAKGQQLVAEPAAAVVFHWARLERQVRCRGVVAPIPDEVSDEYFAGRPRGSRVGAWASDQSSPIPDRPALDAQAQRAADRFADGPVPRPDHWRGHRLVPDEVELWQGRPSRLHDRLLARRGSDGWAWTRLQP